jgi:hypothetical protein
MALERGRSRDEESCILKCFMIYTPPPVLFIDEIDENVLARALDEYGEKYYMQGFGVKHEGKGPLRRRKRK